MVRGAVADSHKMQQAEFDRVQNATLTNLVDSWKQELVNAGVTQSVLNATVQAALQNTSLSHLPSAKRATTPAATMPTSKKPKVTKDRGSKEVPEAPSLRNATAEAKLQWADRIYDPDVGSYTEKSRAQLNRNNKIAKCFRDCCSKDVAAFLAKHGNDKGNFVISQFKACETCKK